MDGPPQRRPGGPRPHLTLDTSCGQDIAVDDYTPGPATVTSDTAFQYDRPYVPDDDHVSQAPTSPTTSRRGSIRSHTSYSSYNSNRELLNHDDNSGSSLRSHSPEPGTEARRSGSTSSRISLHRRSPSNLSVTSVMSIASNSKRLTRELPEPTIFVEKPRKGLVCMICQAIFQDPVLVNCGHSFCRKCVVSLPQGGTCPHKAHREIVLSKTQLISNISIVEELADLEIRCRHGLKIDTQDEGGVTYTVDSDGCPEIIKMGERAAHEDDCSYRLVECPNSALCGLIRKMNLETHLKSCEYFTCKHRVRGCQFIGTNAAVNEHAKSCKFEMVKGLLQGNDSRIQSLSEALESKDQEIEFLKAMLAKLSEKVEDMEMQFGSRMHALHVEVEDTSRAVTEMRYEMGQVHNKLDMVDQLQDAQTTSHVFKCIGTFVGHQGPVWALAVHSNTLFSGSSDETVKVWDTRTAASFKVKKTLQNHRGIVHALCTHNNILYSGSHDCTINVWDIDQLTLLDTLIGHDNPVCTLAVANNLLFSGSLKVVNIWDLQTRALIGCLSGFNHWVRALVATPEYLFAGSYQVVSIFSSRPTDILPKFEDGQEPQELESLRTSGGSIYSVCITEKYIICGTYEHLIHIWDGSTLEEVRTLEGHGGTVYALAVMLGSGNGRDRLFSASYDRSIRVWCLEQFTCLQILARHENSVDALAIHRGWVFSGAADSNIKVWQ